MATGLARGAAKKGKPVAFGDGNRIIWDQHSEQIFRSNPNIAMPSHHRDRNLTWIPFYKGHRIYNSPDRANNRWKWNYEFKAVPGEI